MEDRVFHAKHCNICSQRCFANAIGVEVELVLHKVREVFLDRHQVFKRLHTWAAGPADSSMGLESYKIQKEARDDGELEKPNVIQTMNICERTACRIL
jgi:hypothetical protein